MFTKIIANFLSVSLICATFSTQVSAAMIGTQQALSIEARSVQIAEIEARLAREDVQMAMINLGVDPQQAQLRVAFLTDQELLQLDNQLDSLPAGGDSVLVILGIVFLVLLILELTGVIDIFKKT